MTVRDVRYADLVDRYDLVLFDAYGVLVHGTGLMPGAVAAIELLEQRGKAYCVVTNDASKLPENAAVRYASLGLALDASRIVTSGMLLESHFRDHGLRGARCAVLGPPDGLRYVQRAGGEVVPVNASFDVLVICDESGFPFLEMADATLTSLVRMLDAGREVRLVVPNPDIIYPDGTHAFGFAAGSVALMFEAALARRYPGRTDLRFVRLGKPEPGLYLHALALAGTRSAVMIGDQLETDIAGANRAGIDSALLTTGVSLGDLHDTAPDIRPTYRIARLDR
ncbi:MAG: HAD-IA family hydrolase [Betaproteobacteria bacterium]|nr:HAD-IA family hydrolase [Betaproteobacteria bacterium]